MYDYDVFDYDIYDNDVYGRLCSVLLAMYCSLDVDP